MAKAIAQSGVIPIRNAQICLVTSRSGARWVIPKGHIDRLQTPWEAARQEAWEEAGLVGELLPQPVGRFSYRKLNLDYEVTVFVMLVKLETETWPEKATRTRAWVDPAEALRRLQEPELRVLIQQYFQSHFLD